MTVTPVAAEFSNASSKKPSLVVIGNGMAGMRTVEELLKLAPDLYDITVFGAEPHGNYNRILLSPVLAGDKSIDDIMLNTREWYEQNNITLHAGDPVEKIDRRNRTVRSQAGVEIQYDRLLLATGSKPFIIPVPGHELPGVIAFRDIQDVNTMLDAVRNHRHAVVIGGGLLGLEAANGLLRQGMDVTVVHVTDSLMNQQLDKPAAALLKKALEMKGLRFLLNAQTESIVGADRVTAVRFKDGSEIPADLVVMTAGVRPNIELAKGAGLHCDRAIVVDDTLQTYDPRIYAVGECVQHRTATKLKVTGVDLYSAGDFIAAEDTEDLVLRDPRRGIYKRLVLKGSRLIGAVLYGDVKDGPWYFDLIQKGGDISAIRHQLLFGQAICSQAQGNKAA